MLYVWKSETLKNDGRYGLIVVDAKSVEGARAKVMASVDRWVRDYFEWGYDLADDDQEAYDELFEGILKDLDAEPKVEGVVIRWGR